MLRLVALATFSCLVAADTQCQFTRNMDACPTLGQSCNEQQLCAKGLYCRATSIGQNSWTGICDTAPALADVYGTECLLGATTPQCIFNNPLALSPQDPPSSLPCLRAFRTDPTGTCRIGPNIHGDACNQDGECASGRCQRQLRQCLGLDEGEACTPGYPDPCMKDHYCQPTINAETGECRKVISAGKSCTYESACERGTFCAGPSLLARTCIAPFTVPIGSNTTIGPYMCATGNALMVQPNPADDALAIYQCVNASSTQVGQLWDNTLAPPAGYEVKCSSSGTYRLSTIGSLGLGGRAAAWKELYSCLLTAQNIMSESCEFDYGDLVRVRYGSCVYYSCYPYYLQLVNSTGGRTFNPPLDQFQPFAKCEFDAATSYYQNVLSTPCLTLPNLENWKCADLSGPRSLSISSTSAVVAIIIIFVFCAYWGHMYKYRIHTTRKLFGFM